MPRASNIIVLGASGMLGGYMAAYLRERGHEVFCPKGFDAQVEVPELVAADAVVNCVGVIKQRASTPETMIAVNAVFPHRLARACEKIGAHLIHVSTDCVFDGARGKYTEEDAPNATDLYGRSKLLGEPPEAAVIRTSLLGSERANKLSLLEWVKSRADGSCDGYANHFWNGITCLQCAKLCETIIREKTYWKGVRHYFSSRDVSKYELVSLISDAYRLGVTVRKTDAPIPCDRTLRTVRGLPAAPAIEAELRELAAWDKKRKP